MSNDSTAQARALAAVCGNLPTLQSRIEACTTALLQAQRDGLEEAAKDMEMRYKHSSIYSISIEDHIDWCRQRAKEDGG